MVIEHSLMKSVVRNTAYNNLSKLELIAKLRQSELKIKKFEQDQSRVNTIYYITRSLSKELDLDNLLQLLMDEVKNALQADRCTVFLVDESKNELWSHIGHGLEKNEIRFPIDKGIAGHVAKLGEVVNINDCYSDPRFNPEIDRKTGYVTQNMLAFPMRNNLMEVIGVFQVLNKRSGEFSDADVRLLEAIAPIAAVQIENAQLYEEIRQTFDSLVLTLSRIIDARDPLTAGHSHRIMLFADAIAREAKWDFSQREVLRIAALLHDLGKIGVRESILTKKGKLTEEEFEHLKYHVVHTRTFLRQIHFSGKFAKVPEIAATHHERMDGSGYPDGLKGKEIPLGGRILAISDIFDALTSKRHYRERMNFSKVMKMLENSVNMEIDEYFFNLFMNISLEKIITILEIANKEKIDKMDLSNLRKYSLNDLRKALKSNKKKTGWVELFFRYYQKNYLKES